MRLVYMDEAGISNPKQEPWLVVAAVIVHADNKLVAIERHLDALVARHIPEEMRDGFVFHATELFNGGGKVFDRQDPRFSLEKRLKIADDLAAIPKRFKLPISFGFVERAKFPQFDTGLAETISEQEKRTGAHLVAFSSCSMGVEMWMRREAKHEVCLLVVEDNSQVRERLKSVHEFQQSKDLGGFLDDTNRKYFPYRKIKEDPLFQQKRPSSLLQVADFCAYVFKKFLMEDARYNRFFDPMRHLVVHEKQKPIEAKKR